MRIVLESKAYNARTACNVTQFMEKPIDPDVLLKVVAELIREEQRDESRQRTR